MALRDIAKLDAIFGHTGVMILAITPQ
jgi:hypothetical protein